jgi:hypothetical protein
MVLSNLVIEAMLAISFREICRIMLARSICLDKLDEFEIAFAISLLQVYE